MSNDAVLLEKDGAIATITVNRPDVLNAINYDVFDGLEAAVEDVAQDKSVRVVVITGAGEKAFVAGADISILETLDPFTGQEYCQRGQAVYSKIEKLGKPVIGKINGYALGGGCELAMVCDFRIASTKARFGLPETGLGVIPGFGGTQRLPRIVGVGVAKEMIMTGDRIRADRAYEVGLVNKVVEPEELDSTVKEIAEKIAARSASALKYAKASINDGLQMDLDTAVEMESVQFAVSFAAPDRVEGLSAFLEKRTPEFE